MRRKPRQFAVLAAVVMTAGCLLALSIFVRSWLQEPATSPEAHQPAFGAGPDFDNDGRPDRVAVSTDGVTVTSAAGGQLLVYKGTVLPGHQVLRLGGEYPVLFVQTARGEYAGFAYDPGKGLLQVLTWPGGGQRGYGELTASGALRQPVVGASVRTREVALALDKLRLTEAGVVWSPYSAPRATPADALAAAVESVVLGLEQELKVHFPDADVARSFWMQWNGKLPAGGVVRVAQADDVNAGAEHGHLVPVTVWVSGKAAVAGLKGQAEFASAPGGVVIRRLSLTNVPLKVTSWSQAATLAGAGAKPSDSPFYGVFRFVAAQKRWAVDAVTGRVENE